MKGKQICNTLRDIRLSIAQANDIDYTPVECNHNGDCLGTCPQCEKELKYIERQLLRHHAIGKVAIVAGLTLGATSVAPVMAQTQMQPSTNVTHSQALEIVDFAPNDTAAIIVKGCVVDKENEPLVGATLNVIWVAPQSKLTKSGIATNFEGQFAIRVPKGTKVNLSYVGYESITIQLNEPDDNLVIKMEDEIPSIMGYVVPLSTPQMSDSDSDIYEMR